MKKLIWNSRGSRITNFNSLHKTFNKTIQAPSKGNVIDDGFISLFVRSWDEVECNGITNQPGHLYNFDMNSFRDAPSYIKQKAKQGGVLVHFRYYKGDKKISLGWLLYDYSTMKIKAVDDYNRVKNASLIEEFIQFIK
jgi:hypothetical protein